MLKLTLALLTLLGISTLSKAQAMTAENLRCEYLPNPLSVDTTHPRLSWNLNSPRRGEKQTAYQLQVASSPSLLEKNTPDLWNSNKVTTSDSTATYNGKPLASGATAFWKVRAWNRQGKPSAWSPTSQFSVGLLNTSDWKAQWIGMASATENDCPWFRKDFNLEKVPQNALAYIGSIGFHELYINGQRIGDQVLSPSTSDLTKRALYNTYDIKPYLHQGANTIGLWLAPGWSQFKNGNPMVAPYKGKMSITIAQLQLDETTITSDETWRCNLSTTTHLGNWQYADFGGDAIDARREAPGWNSTNFDDSTWEKATLYHPNLQLSSDFVEPNRKLEKIVPTQVNEISPHKARFNLPKLFTGWIEVALKGTPGQKITIRSSSLPDKEEEYNQRDEYIIGPSGQGTFCNRFSYHEIGFVTIEGLDYTPSPQDVIGYRIGNDRPRTAHFDCSNPLLKQIYDITLNTYENLTTGGITVDCPHRERLGYGGDAHGSLELAVDNFESDAFFSRWAQDWIDTQSPEGRIPHTAPQTGGGGGPAWSGIIVTMPWEVYQSYGDKRILEKTYPAARRWLDFVHSHLDADGILQPTFGGIWSFLGDWVAPGRRESSDKPETLPFNNCYYLYVTRLAAKTARALGKPGDAALLEARATRLKAAIIKRFIDPKTKAYFDLRQTRTIMALISEAVNSEDLNDVMKNLETELLITRNGHLDTGLHGTYFLTKYLTEHNRSDLIYTYATQTTAPGYGDLIAKGYTTWPEYWNGSDSKIHGCLNGIGGWFTRGIAGIRVDTPGFKHFTIHPAIVGDLTWAKTEFQSPQGLIISHWKRDAKELTMEITIPTNTTATIYVPAKEVKAVKESGQLATQSKGVKFLRIEAENAVFEVESGQYHFEAPRPTNSNGS